MPLRPRAKYIALTMKLFSLITILSGLTLAVSAPSVPASADTLSGSTAHASVDRSTERLRLEAEVLKEINLARMNPRGYAEVLRAYRQRFRGNEVHYPDTNEVLITEEGVAAVDEAIRFLQAQHALPPLSHAQVLALASTDHVRDQGPQGLIGHESSADGADPWDRVVRRGGGDYVEEIISYGPTSAREAVIAWIVNDGSPERGHREAVFDDEMSFAGVGCGSHSTYNMMCVVDMARTPSGHY